MPDEVLIRDASDADMLAIQMIYSHYVLNNLCTFEEVPPTIAEMRARRQTAIDSGHPYLVAVLDGEVLGYAYTTAYRSRSAYRFAVENSVYVGTGRHRGGIGSLLLNALIKRCEALPGRPWRQMIAVIGDSANAASIALHQKCGFRHVGTLTAVGFKHDSWVDTVLMQRALGDGATANP